LIIGKNQPNSKKNLLLLKRKTTRRILLLLFIEKQLLKSPLRKRKKELGLTNTLPMQESVHAAKQTNILPLVMWRSMASL
jgi:hypothetical protein